MRNVVLISVVVAIASGVHPVFAGVNKWTSAGPEGASVTALVVDPNTSSTIYAGTPKGIFRSLDSGEHWTAVESAGTHRFSSIAVAPASSTVYAGTEDGTLLKSIDGATTWNELAGGFQEHGPIATILVSGNIVHVATPSAIFRSVDAGAKWIETDAGLTPDRISSLVSTRGTTPRILYAATDTGLFASLNDGTDWTRRTPSNFSRLAVDSINPFLIYACVLRNSFVAQIARSTDGGATWRNMLAVQQVDAIVTDPVASSVVHVLRDGVIYRSEDAGETWSRTFAPDRVWINSLAIDPTNSAFLFAGSTASGIFKSTDKAAHWQEAYAGIYAAPSQAIALSSDGATAYAATFGGLFKSSDAGESWRHAEIELPQVSSVTVDPKSSRIVFAAGSQTAKKSTDGGETWSLIQPSPRGWANGTARFTVDPMNSAKVYAALTDGLAKSSDGGATWFSMGSGQLPAGYYGLFYGTDIAVDPSTPGTMYAAGVKLAKTTDAGDHWTVVKTLACGFEYVRSVALSARTPQTLYAACGSQLFRSDDRGETWQSGRQGIPEAAAINDVAIDPVHSSTVYAATGAGVFISTDRGDHWFGFNFGMTGADVESIAIDATGTRILAGTIAGTYVYTRDSSYLSRATTYRVSLRTFLGNYVSAVQCGGSEINADADAEGPCETFTLYDMNAGPLADGDLVSLQAASGSFVVAEHGGSRGCQGCVSTVNGNRPIAGPWETFTIHKMNGEGPIVAGDSISLQSSYGDYVTAENGGMNGCGCTSTVTATRSSAQAWETFRLSIR